MRSDRHWQIRLAACLLLTCLGTWAYAAEAAELCETVEKLRLAKNSFADFKGAQIPAVGGASDCKVVEKQGDTFLTCVGPWSDDGKSVAMLTDSTANSIRTCLGAGWQRTTRRLGDRIAIFMTREGAPSEFQLTAESRLVQAGDESAASLLGERAKMVRQWRTSFSVANIDGSSGVSPTPAWKTDARQFCNRLTEVMESGAKKFDSIKGTKSGDDWVSKLALPGMTRCEISESSDLSYFSCRVGVFSRRAELRYAQTELLKDIRNCLGATWSSRKRPRGDSVWSIDIEQPNNDVSLELGARQRDSELVLDIDVNVENP